MRKLSKALIHLRQDQVLKSLIDQFGVLNYRPSKDLFTSLVYSIIEQQLSGKAAETIYNRFLKLFPSGKYTARAILDLDLSLIRSCGTSWAKARSLHDLSQKHLNGTLQLNKLDKMSDAEVIVHLVKVKGIGKWTAEMRLMFSLGRPDILPLDDVGIQNAFVKHYGLNRRHKTFTKKMIKIAESWRPWRTIACWYLWKSLDNQPGKD